MPISTEESKLAKPNQEDILDFIMRPAIVMKKTVFRADHFLSEVKSTLPFTSKPAGVNNLPGIYKVLSLKIELE